VLARAVLPINFFFFFQAEDGIRDKLVTGVQTCALPISESFDSLFSAASKSESKLSATSGGNATVRVSRATWEPFGSRTYHLSPEIGRASCRERVLMAVGGVLLQKKGGWSEYVAGAKYII